MPRNNLSYARLHNLFFVECDASRNGIGVVLMQEGIQVDFESHPVKGKYLQKLIYDTEM